jgi:hypothetical protein
MFRIYRSFPLKRSRASFHYEAEGSNRTEPEGTMNNETARNAARRFPVSYGLRYVMTPPATEPIGTGAGETVWMSRHEVAFLAKGPANVGDKVQIYIAWPVLLNDAVPLQLILNAEIVQCSGPLSIAKLTKHEFRTRRLQSSSMAARPLLPLAPVEQYPSRRMPYGQSAAAAIRPWQEGSRPAAAAAR